MNLPLDVKLETKQTAFIKADKRRLALNFAKAADAYEREALIQKDIAKALFSIINSNLISVEAAKANKVQEPLAAIALDLGCATGVNIEQLSSYAQRIFGLDISIGMLQKAQTNTSSQHTQGAQWLAGDAEKLPLSNQAVNVVFSSMALQWVQSPFQALSEIERVLSRNGHAFLAIMLGSSMHELHDAYANLGVASRVNRFHSNSEWIDALQLLKHEKQVNTVSYEKRTFTSYHPSALAMLKSLKSVGASTKQNTISNNAAITKAELYALEQSMVLEKDGFPLSYDVLFIRFNK